ncbi:MAG: TGS domain-containing protein, partial [Bacteroidales bacterium]
MINITFPDNAVRQYPEGITALEIAKNISEGLARNVLSAKINGEVMDACMPIHADASIVFYTWDHEAGKATFWHSSSHLMAEAVEFFYPGVKFGIGPDIENGFYYDIDLGDRIISSDDFKKIEDKMLEIAKRKNTFERREVSKPEAIEYFTKKNDPYKLDLLKELEDGTITLYESGNFTDLCRGPHLPDTGFIKAVKLLNIAGAYWRGDEHNKQLTRIYGISFPKQKELEEYLVLLEEAKKRDHRKLGKELELFAFSPKVGMGLPLWLPKGTDLRERLESFLKKVQKKAG